MTPVPTLLPPWGGAIILAPVVGGMGVAFLVQNFAPEAKGHGVPEVSVRTILPVTISTATAAYVGQLLFSPHPSFMIPAFQQPYFAVTNLEVLLGYLVLRAITGIASAIYIRSIYASEDFFERWIPRDYYLRHGCGMLLLGVVMYLLFRTTGHYHIEGVGYATIQDASWGPSPIRPCSSCSAH